ncbi:MULTISPECIES: hypothetical protein [unclassified Acidiphilium]|uniref:hypothetical protein n=1 Tax=unclassified Acidiphilium TaxID=2617493 RepID=UPI000BD78444|nr:MULTISPECIES: hypothetical protein [unclassified Acidiphilium]OYV55917.1 MAG: hypothetical protein B7Z76_08215 [Acidiphilium sp. 20-67-58]HQT62562.1 hypothetical protein [Acidiphilium sp.]
MTIALRFAAIIDGLRRAVAARAVKDAFFVFDQTMKPASPHRPLVVRLWTWLGRLSRRFAALAAGAPKKRAPKKRAQAPQLSPSRAAISSTANPLPRHRAWLLAPVPESRCSASQLRALLDDPEALALIGSDPRFARLLRPLCHMLGLRLPPCLVRTARPRPAQPPPHQAHDPRVAPAGASPVASPGTSPGISPGTSFGISSDVPPPWLHPPPVPT